MAAGRLHGDRVQRHVHDVGAEQFHRLEHLRPGVAVGADLDQDELALHGLRRLELDDLEHVDQLVELLSDLLERVLLAVHHDRHPGDLLMLGGPHSERVDVEPAARKQAGDSDKDPGLVLHQHGECVLGHSIPPSQSGAMPRANLMSSLLVPAATIGHTIASLCTMKSITTGWSLIAMACSMIASTSSLRSQRSPMQPYASASLTKSGIRVPATSAFLSPRLVLEYRSS